MLLAELGDYVRRVQWDETLRERWAALHRGDDEEDAVTLTAADLEMTARDERHVRSGEQSAFGLTRFVLAHDLGAQLLGRSDVRVLSVSSTPDRFDRQWRVTKAFPFVRRSATVHRATAPREIEPVTPEMREQLLARHELATLIVAQLALPLDDAPSGSLDDQRDRKALVAARKILADEDVAAKRSALHEWVAKYEPRAWTPETKVEEFEELVEASNAAVSAKKKVKAIATGLLLLRPAAAGGSMFVTEAALAGPAGGAIGEIATRHFTPGDWQPKDIKAAALIRDVRKVLRS